MHVQLGTRKKGGEIVRLKFDRGAKLPDCVECRHRAVDWTDFHVRTFGHFSGVARP
jgi:hypothetical protein